MTRKTTCLYVAKAVDSVQVSYEVVRDVEVHLQGKMTKDAIEGGDAARRLVFIFRVYLSLQ